MGKTNLNGIHNNFQSSYSSHSFITINMQEYPLLHLYLKFFFSLELILSKNVTNISLILVRSGTELSKLNEKKMYFDEIVLRCEKTRMLSKAWT